MRANLMAVLSSISKVKKIVEIIFELPVCVVPDLPPFDPQIHFTGTAPSPWKNVSHEIDTLNGCINKDTCTLSRKPIYGRVTMSQTSNIVAFRGRKGSAPNIENGNVPPARRKNRAIQHYLGHKNIQHTVRYTELSANRFRDFWKD